VALAAVTAHDAARPARADRRVAAVSDTGHGERGGSAHLDPLVLKVGHECPACWIGHVGGLAPSGVVAQTAGPALASAPRAVALLGVALAGVPLGRAPPLLA
jgi:hypothetical protein